MNLTGRYEPPCHTVADRIRAGHFDREIDDLEAAVNARRAQITLEEERRQRLNVLLASLTRQEREDLVSTTSDELAATVVRINRGC